MSCCYCWNRGGSFGNAPLLMGEREARLVAELIASVAAESKAERIYINFYGGEPLLNFEALQTITLQLLRDEKRLGKKFHFTVDTNGWFLEGEVADFLAGHFSLVGVSVDGREEVHDRQRPGERGERTWRRIVSNLALFPNRKLLGVRATLTASSDSYLKTFRQLLTLGINRIQLEYCHEPGYHDDPAYEELIVPQERQLAELEEFIDEYVATISNYRDTGAMPFVPTLMDNVTRIRRGNRFTRPCGAGINTLAINSRGEIFPCIAFADRDPFNMGSVGEKRPLPLHHTLEGFDVDQQEEFGSCWLRYDCAGGCYATHYEMTGHPRHPHPEYCRNMRAKGELQLYAMARMIQHCPWHLESPSD